MTLLTNKLGVPVFGVSPDSLASHAKFIAKHDLNFVLLADEDHALADKLKVWGEKSMYGRTFMGIERSTFLVGPDGKIAHVWPKVDPVVNAKEVLDTVAALGGPKH